MDEFKPLNRTPCIATIHLLLTLRRSACAYVLIIRIQNIIVFIASLIQCCGPRISQPNFLIAPKRHVPQLTDMKVVRFEQKRIVVVDLDARCVPLLLVLILIAAIAGCAAAGGIVLLCGGNRTEALQARRGWHMLSRMLAKEVVHCCDCRSLSMSSYSTMKEQGEYYDS
ncbi:hypothetical protein EJ04DRAFT_526291 [Polyplosphaeria fusca]|uniref:Uncharacterized protein n=1 Tax=Polyplosphaeria fusca TaxID=682080 RepID=A0A9P4QUP5_9PLEO|nr:hypothetical protein EJ04DRAFT_526291 [Polyplosphaeria fusca]